MLKKEKDGGNSGGKMVADTGESNRKKGGKKLFWTDSRAQGKCRNTNIACQLPCLINMHTLN